MQSRDFSTSGFDQATVEAELQMSRGCNLTGYRFEALDLYLNKVRDVHGVEGGGLVNDREARIPRTSKMSIREIPAADFMDYRSRVLSYKPVGYWQLGKNDALGMSFVMI